MASLLGNTPIIGFSTPAGMTSGRFAASFGGGGSAGRQDARADVTWLAGYTQGSREVSQQLADLLKPQTRSALPAFRRRLQRRCRAVVRQPGSRNEDVGRPFQRRPACRQCLPDRQHILRCRRAGPGPPGRQYPGRGRVRSRLAAGGDALPRHPLARLLGAHPGRAACFRSLCPPVWLSRPRLGFPAARPPGPPVSAGTGTTGQKSAVCARRCAWKPMALSA